MAALVFVGSAQPATAQGVGLTIGPTFDEFSGEALDFNNRTGAHVGLFFGGNRDGVLGVQGEINWLRKKTELLATRLESSPLTRDIRIDYLQVPVLLRLNAGSDSTSGFAAYAIAGPAIEVKIADEVEGFTLDDGFEGADVSLVFGAGIEFARIIVEGRYEKGLRRINDTFSDFAEIKKQAFTILFGVRFR
jgi:opacity protein-like surface antigen